MRCDGPAPRARAPGLRQTSACARACWPCRGNWSRRQTTATHRGSRGRAPGERCRDNAARHGRGSRRVRVAERAELVVLILENVRVDRARRATPAAAAAAFTRASIGVAVREIPQDVERHRRTRTGERMDLSRVGQLFLDRRRRRRLQEFPEAGAGVCEAPRRQFDRKCVQCGGNDLGDCLGAWRRMLPPSCWSVRLNRGHSQARVVSQSETRTAIESLASGTDTLCMMRGHGSASEKLDSAAVTLRRQWRRTALRLWRTVVNAGGGRAERTCLKARAGTSR